MRGVNISVLRTSILRRSFILGGIGTVGILAACIGPNYDSVHFYSDWNRFKVDFGRVPQEAMVSGWNREAIRSGTNYDSGIPPFENYFDEALTEEKTDENRWGQDKEIFEAFRTAIHRSRNLEVRHQYKDAVAAFRSTSPAQRIQSLARDREELINAGATKSTKGYQEYLSNRYLLEFGYEKQKEAALQVLRSLDGDPIVKPHIAYTLAGSASEPAKAYLEVSTKYPTSPRAESALIMSGRAMVEDSVHSDWDKGIKTFQTVLEKYPQTRFRPGIYGWFGADELKKNHTEQAITFYLKQSRSNIPWEAWKGHQALGEIAQRDGRVADSAVHWLAQSLLPISTHFKLTSSRQIRSAFSGFNQKDAKILQAKIKNSPDLLSAYLDFRIEDTSLTPDQEKGLLTFASDRINAIPKVSSNIITRLAQLQFNAGQYKDAARTARRSANRKDEVGMRAAYIEGSSLARLGDNQRAITTFERLYRQNAKPYIHKSAAEYLALLHEKFGDPRRSLELYRDLKYDSDYAFVADSVLTPAQLKSAVRKIKRGEERDALNYTLAMRYFRKGNYGNAKSILSKMDKTLRIHKGLTSKKYKEFIESTYFETIANHEVDPLIDVEKMQHLRYQAEHTRNREAKAKAIYGMAQYTRQRRNLMFYSAGIWRGGRADVFGLYWNEGVNKGLSEKRAWQSAYEHECDAQTIKFCEELIERCPRSKLVPKALYTAGVAAERLQALNSWWDHESPRLLHKAATYMRTIVKKYPHHELAKPAAKYSAEFADEAKPKY